MDFTKLPLRRLGGGSSEAVEEDFGGLERRGKQIPSCCEANRKETLHLEGSFLELAAKTNP